MKRLECIMYYNMGVEWEHVIFILYYNTKLVIRKRTCSFKF